jgi:hypothetical protein
MDHVFQTHLPVAPWREPAMARLPGVQPLDMADWLVVDEAFAGQMALRDRLLAERRKAVYAMTPGAEDAAEELLALVLEHLGPGYGREGGVVQRPDGVRVALDAEPPLVTAARLVQEDLCLMQRAPGGEHVLTGAVLCFPASWTLAEKIGRPLWRQNALVYVDPALHQPRPEAAPRREAPGAGRYLRSEKQCLLRLPSSGAVAFTIHTYVIPLDALPEGWCAGLTAAEIVT